MEQQAWAQGRGVFHKTIITHPMRFKVLPNQVETNDERQRRLAQENIYRVLEQQVERQFINVPQD
jgi:hypothetical protein